MLSFALFFWYDIRLPLQTERNEADRRPGGGGRVCHFVFGPFHRPHDGLLREPPVGWVS